MAAADELWGSRILPRETFRQYFGRILALGDESSTFGHLTAPLRQRIADLVLENRVVSAFVDVCPGLEPAVLAGKLHWEATEGTTPEEGLPWRHVVVDAPATGHGLMLFRSTAALAEVFGNGVIFRQAVSIMALLRDPARTHVFIVATPEELPLQEALEIHRQLRDLKVSTYRFVINRMHRPSSEDPSTVNLSPDWQRELAYEFEMRRDRETLLQDFDKRLEEKIPRLVLPEIYTENPATSIDDFTEVLKEQGL